MWVDGRVVVNNDGLHGARTRHGRRHLRRGWHRVRVDMFENGGGAYLAVSWHGPGFGWRPIHTYRRY